MKKVAIVGVEGSGKTVMLAGLGELYARADENGYFLAPKNFQTASYVSGKISRMRKGKWPMATPEDVLQGLDWTLRQRRGDGQRPVDVCEVSCLDFAGEVYRYAFVRQGAVPTSLEDEVASLKSYVRSADDLIVLINLRDIIVMGEYDSRVQEAMWITNAILSYALDGQDGRRVPRAAIVLSQADSYADTIRSCGGAKGVLARYLPHVANNYDWLDILAVSAVDKTVLDDNGNMVPAPDFQPTPLRAIMDWIRYGLNVTVQQRSPQPPPPRRGGQSRRPVTSVEPPPSGLGQYFTFRGRKNRAQYWGFICFAFVTGVCVGLFSGGNEALIGLFVLALVWPSISNAVRRLHDFNRSGWWWWLCCIQPIGWLVAIIIGLIGGTKGDNDYGPEP